MEWTGNYRVEWDEYTKRHYAKVFQKKYRDEWAPTVRDITSVCERIDNMLQYDRADLICAQNEYKLVKLDFAIEGSRISPKSSGNRCILFIDENKRLVRVLLVYSKNEICVPNETQKWKTVVKEQFSDIGKIFSL